MKSLAQRIWRVAPVEMRRRFWTSVNSARAAVIQSRVKRFAPAPALTPQRGPLVIAGVFRSASGLGQAARSTYFSLKAAGLKPIAVDLTETFTPVDLDPGIPLEAIPRSETGTLIAHLNAPEMPAVLDRLGYLQYKRWRVIGYWAWELPAFPKGWDAAFGSVSELWTLSPYTASSIGSHPDAPPVASFSIGVEPPAPDAAASPVPADPRRFTVLTAADAFSSFARKNPIGAIAAFRRAFGDQADCRLIVKTRNLAAAPDARAAIETAISGARNITLVDRALTRAELWALFHAADAYLSLHRAEGFGLPMAEAMAIGKPVVATGWSGNLSFMTAETAKLVSCSLGPVSDPFGIYEGFAGEWAEPNLDHASQMLRELYENPEERHAVGVRARNAIAEVCSYEAIGKKMAAAINTPKR